MTRDEILNRIKQESAKLAEFRIKALYLFGSASRNELSPGSDVDFLVEFEGAATFDRYVRLQALLEELLNCRVDLVTRKGLRKELIAAVEKDCVRAA